MTINSNLSQINLLKDQLNGYILGQEKIIDFILIAIICGGHILLEGVPGTAKTSLVKVLARLINSPFKRIQLTPDMLPSDIIGTSIFDFNLKTFNLHYGPIFTSLILADEINRTPPKTQSALLEAMEERQVTIDGSTELLPDFFLVIATQNSIEFEGTYPLPEAQLDRFMFKLNFNYPDNKSELAMLKLWQNAKQNKLIQNIESIVTIDELLMHKANVQSIVVEDNVLEYLISLADLSRHLPQLRLGASPRATLNWLMAAKALAYIRGCDYVTPDDIKFVAHPILEHRLIINPESELEGNTISQVIDLILNKIKVPR